MALTPIRQLDLSIHGKPQSVIETLLVDGAVSSAKIADNSITESKIAIGTITNLSIAQTASISDAALDVISSAGKVLNSATSATAAATADAIVARDADGGFSAGDVNVANLSASGDLSVTGEATLNGNVTIQGDLIVNGNTTSVNSVDLVVNDRLIHLNEPATLGANDPVPTGLSGVSIHRGTEAGEARELAGMVWDEAASKFVFQLMNGEAAGSARLDVEVRNIGGKRAEFATESGGINSMLSLTDAQFTVEQYDANDAALLRVDRLGLFVEYVNNVTNEGAKLTMGDAGALLQDAAGAALLPTADAGLAVKKYVDDADAILQSAIDGHEARLDVMDIIDTTEQAVVFENNAAVYADGFAPVKDANHRDGWYFKNDVQGNKINWYFFDGQTENVTLGDFSAYAVVTFDSTVSRPHLGVYTVPTGSDDAASWYKSRAVYVIDGVAVAGKKYLMYFGQDPKVHPELPRLTMIQAENSNGTRLPTERVLTAVLGSDSGSSANNVQFVAEAVGVYSSTIKRKISLRIRTTAQTALDAEITRALAAEAVLRADIEAEALRAIGREDALELSISNEVTNRQQELADAVALLEQADSTLAADLSDEVTRALAAEDNLDAKIDEEIFNRSEADTLLSSRVDAEEARALAAEADLQANIDLKFDKAGGPIDPNGSIGLSITGSSAAVDGTGIVISSDSSATFGPDTTAVSALQLASLTMSVSSNTDPDFLIGTTVTPGSLDVTVNNGTEQAANFFTNIDGLYATYTNGELATGMSVGGALIELSSGDAAGQVRLQVEPSGASLVDANGDPNLPTEDRHLVVKKYVDDAFSGIAAKQFREAFIYEAVGGETSLAAPAGAPAIPDNAATEVYIDGRKVFRSSDGVSRQFNVVVAEDGSSISFAALAPGQTVELRYFA